MVAGAGLGVEDTRSYWILGICIFKVRLTGVFESPAMGKRHDMAVVFGGWHPQG